MNQEFRVDSESGLDVVIQALEKEISEYPIILLKGPMGSGKTTLVKRWLDPDGRGLVSSPTFSIVNEYVWNGAPLFHFDLYRIEESEELSEIGFEEYMESGHPCLIEWPEMGKEFLDIPHILLEIEMTEDHRSFRISRRNGYF